MLQRRSRVTIPGNTLFSSVPSFSEVQTRVRCASDESVAWEAGWAMRKADYLVDCTAASQFTMTVMGMLSVFSTALNRNFCPSRLAT